MSSNSRKVSGRRCSIVSNDGDDLVVQLLASDGSVVGFPDGGVTTRMIRLR